MFNSYNMHKEKVVLRIFITERNCNFYFYCVNYFFIIITVRGTNLTCLFFFLSEVECHIKKKKKIPIKLENKTACYISDITIKQTTQLKMLSRLERQFISFLVNSIKQNRIYSSSVTQKIVFLRKKTYTWWVQHYDTK